MGRLSTLLSVLSFNIFQYIVKLDQRLSPDKLDNPFSCPTSFQPPPPLAARRRSSNHHHLLPLLSREKSDLISSQPWLLPSFSVTPTLAGPAKGIPPGPGGPRPPGYIRRATDPLYIGIPNCSYPTKDLLTPLISKHGRHSGAIRTKSI